MDREVHEVRLANWKQLILQCQNRPAGMTQKEWMNQHNIPESQFYYWLRRVRREAFAEMADTDSKNGTASASAGCRLAAPVAFAEIDLAKVQEYQETAPKSSAAAVIRFGKLSVELSNAADEQLISGILKAVSHAC